MVRHEQPNKAGKILAYYCFRLPAALWPPSSYKPMLSYFISVFIQWPGGSLIPVWSGQILFLQQQHLLSMAALG